MAFVLNYQAEGASGKNEQSTHTQWSGAQYSRIGSRPALPISFLLLNTWLPDSEYELVSVVSLLQKSLSLDELLFRLRCTTTNLSIFPRTLLTITVPEIRTTGGKTPIVTHCATRAEFLHHSMYEAAALDLRGDPRGPGFPPKGTPTMFVCLAICTTCACHVVIFISDQSLSVDAIKS